MIAPEESESTTKLVDSVSSTVAHARDHMQQRHDAQLKRKEAEEQAKQRNLEKKRERQLKVCSRLV